MEDYTYDLGSTEFDKQFEKIVKPTECLFVGVTASNSFNQYMSDHNIEHSNVKSLDKIGNAYGRKHSITIDGRVIPIIGIQHTSHHFEWERWNHISKTTENDILNWLDNNEMFKEIFQ